MFYYYFFTIIYHLPDITSACIACHSQYSINVTMCQKVMYVYHALLAGKWYYKQTEIRKTQVMNKMQKIRSYLESMSFRLGERGVVSNIEST